MALSLTSSAFAFVSPCPKGQNVCEVRIFRDYAEAAVSMLNPFNGVEYPVGKYWAKGVADNYGDAEKRADALLNKTFGNPDCGIWGGPTPAGSDVTRLRSGVEKHTAWVSCNPQAEAYQSRGSSRRLGTMVCGSGGRGCMILR